MIGIHDWKQLSKDPGSNLILFWYLEIADVVFWLLCAFYIMFCNNEKWHLQEWNRCPWVQEAVDHVCSPLPSPTQTGTESEGPLPVCNFLTSLVGRTMSFLHMCHPTTQHILFLLFYNTQNSRCADDNSLPSVLSGPALPSSRHDGPADLADQSRQVNCLTLEQHLSRSMQAASPEGRAKMHIQSLSWKAEDSVLLPTPTWCLQNWFMGHTLTNKVLPSLYLFIGWFSQVIHIM